MIKRIGLIGLMMLSLLSIHLEAQSEAGAIWLLISPGARAGGMGEANVAIANDSYASYFNPAGLAFLRNDEVGAMYVQWLPNLTNDISYNFLTGRHYVPGIGTIGGHIIYLDLGEQNHTDEWGNVLNQFTSYLSAVTISYATQLSPTSAVGLNAKWIYQALAPFGGGREKGEGVSSNFAFDVSYLKKNFFHNNLTFGAIIANIGPKIAFIDAAQADPMPTNLRLGLAWDVINERYNKLSVTFDVNKLLVSSYPDRDVDGDGEVGGYDKDGNYSPGGDYNKDGVRETSHTDDWYVGIFTSWINDWLLLYDSAADGIGDKDEDGNTNDGSLKRELEQFTYNFGVEYWYSNSFAIRFGFLYDKLGRLVWKGKYPIPTFGAGIRFFGFGLDMGYISGDPGHPLQNTTRISLNMTF